MSLDSQSYKPLPKEPLSSFRLELWLGRDEFRQLSGELSSLDTVVYKGHLAYPFLAYAPPPYESFFQIIFALSSIATLADIIYKYLRKYKKNKGHIKFVFNEKEMEIKGNYDKDELEVIIKEFSRTASISEISVISEFRKNQLKEELENIKRHLPTYESLVEIGNERLEKGEKLNLNQHQHYIEELDEMMVRKKMIEDLLEK